MELGALIVPIPMPLVGGKWNVLPRVVFYVEMVAFRPSIGIDEVDVAREVEGASVPSTWSFVFCIGGCGSEHRHLCGDDGERREERDE